MSSRYYTATCTNQFYWNSKPYRNGDPITLSEEDVRTLSEARLIGNVVPLTCEKQEGRTDEIETATKKAPENAMKSYQQKGRR